MNAERSPLQVLADRSLDAVVAKDADAVLAAFSDDGVFIDPHYPDAEMRGRAAIVEGLRFSFGAIQTFAFDERRYFTGSDGTSLVIRCECHHLLPGGRVLDFPQVFVMDTAEGRITRLQAFEPYGPNGLGGVLLGIGKAAHRARRVLRQRAARGRRAGSAR